MTDSYELLFVQFANKVSFIHISSFRNEIIYIHMKPLQQMTHSDKLKQYAFQHIPSELYSVQLWSSSASNIPDLD